MKQTLPSLSLSIVLLTILLVTLIRIPIWPEKALRVNTSFQYCERFAHSRMLIQYEDGTTVGTCSLLCAVMDQALKIDKPPEKIPVGDLNQQNLIDAEGCYTAMQAAFEDMFEDVRMIRQKREKRRTL